jgi:hypothetical protein
MSLSECVQHNTLTYTCDQRYAHYHLQKPIIICSTRYISISFYAGFDFDKDM